MAEHYHHTGPSLFEGPQSKLEQRYIDEYLKSKGIRWADIGKLPAGEAKKLMIEASRYATAKLAQHEARAKFRQDIRYD